MALLIRLPRRGIRNEHVHLSLFDRFKNDFMTLTIVIELTIGETGSFVPLGRGGDHDRNETVWIVLDALTVLLYSLTV